MTVQRVTEANDVGLKLHSCASKLPIIVWVQALSQLLHDAVGGRDGPDVVRAPVHPDEGGPAEVGLAVGLRLGLLPPVHQAAARHADLQRRHVPQLA